MVVYGRDVSYNTSSQMTGLKTGAATSNPRVESYAYDGSTGLLTGQTVKNTAATSTYMDLSYTYLKGNSYGTDTTHKTGQLTKIVDNLDHNRDKLYEFDALGRIRTAKGGSAAGASWVTANWTQTYSYDRYGNKTGVSASGITQDSNAVPADGLASLSMSTSTNRITGWDYDKTGNLIRGQNASGVWWRFEYDAAGRLKKVKDDSNNLFENYTYGAGREKLLVDDGESYSYYVWGGGSVIAEYTSKGGSPTWKKSYIYAGSRLLMAATKVNATTEKHEFHHPDRLGTQLVTNGGTGTSYRQTTLPFGTALGAESTGYSNQVFTSYDRSSSTGLDYAVNRTYSKGQSRFTQVDPIGMNAASLGYPQSNNLYAYTQNMPTDFVDPSGLNEEAPIRVYTWTWKFDYDNFLRFWMFRMTGGGGNNGGVQIQGGGGNYSPPTVQRPGIDKDRVYRNVYNNCMARKKKERSAIRANAILASAGVGCLTGGVSGATTGALGLGLVGLVFGGGVGAVPTGAVGAVTGGVLGCGAGASVGIAAQLTVGDAVRYLTQGDAHKECSNEAKKAIS